MPVGDGNAPGGMCAGPEAGPGCGRSAVPRAPAGPERIRYGQNTTDAVLVNRTELATWMPWKYRAPPASDGSLGIASGSVPGVLGMTSTVPTMPSGSSCRVPMKPGIARPGPVARPIRPTVTPAAPFATSVQADLGGTDHVQAADAVGLRVVRGRAGQDFAEVDVAVAVRVAQLVDDEGAVEAGRVGQAG